MVKLLLKRRSFVSRASLHPKDVPFLREFWWGRYGSGCTPKSPISAVGACRIAAVCRSRFYVTRTRSSSLSCNVYEDSALKTKLNGIFPD